MQVGPFRGAVIVAVTIVAFGGAAPIEAQRPAFKSGVDMVPLTVTVTDPKGKYVTGLCGSDFHVYEDGVEQSLSFFASDAVPIDVALVLDTSSSMRDDLALVRTAAIGLVRRLRAGDRAAIVSVTETAGIPQSFTSDRSLIERAINSLSASGETALYDGMYVLLKEFERERKATTQVRRQALVLLSDGLDNRSRLAFDDVLDYARRVAVNIYVIALRGALAQLPRNSQDGTILQADYALKTVTRESGGRLFFPKAARDLAGIYTAIAEELFSQYELGYMPVRSVSDGGFRRVTITIRPDTNALARTRSGYYAASRATPGL
jgi:Ca-activated chloride channel homolog